jgi:signal transduction histidine kinase
VKNLFTPFWQARTGTKDGAGLGLTISQGIVQAHDGTIWVEGGEGEGATFNFTIPIAPSPVGPVPDRT